MRTTNNTPLAGLTSLRVGGPAQQLIELDQNDTLQSVLTAQTGQIWLLGGGTNCLISDAGLPGTVIVNKTGKVRQTAPNQLTADSGTSWDELVEASIGAGLYGMEFMSGIPGSVGGAVVGNIAAYGQKLADSFVSARLYDAASKTVVEWTKSQFNFSYRYSVLQATDNQHLAILDATFELSRHPVQQLEYQSALKVGKDTGLQADGLINRRQIILETRKRAGSLLTPLQAAPFTAGSFFRNPVVNPEQVSAILAHEEKTGISQQDLLRQNQLHSGNSVRVSAAHVLLAAGFKRGQTWGNVQLHPDHILKVANLGNASAQEIYDVVQKIVQTVQEKLGIKLEPEVRFLGQF